MARKTGKTDLYFPDHQHDSDHVTLRRMRRAALLGGLPGVDPDSVARPEAVEVPTYTVTALSGGTVRLDSNGRPVVEDGRAVLDEPPEEVEAVVREDQVDAYEKTTDRNREQLEAAGRRANLEAELEGDR